MSALLVALTAPLFVACTDGKPAVDELNSSKLPTVTLGSSKTSSLTITVNSSAQSYSLSGNCDPRVSGFQFRNTLSSTGAWVDFSSISASSSDDSSCGDKAFAITIPGTFIWGMGAWGSNAAPSAGQSATIEVRALFQGGKFKSSSSTLIVQLAAPLTAGFKSVAYEAGAGFEFNDSGTNKYGQFISSANTGLPGTTPTSFWATNFTTGSPYVTINDFKGMVFDWQYWTFSSGTGTYTVQCQVDPKIESVSEDPVSLQLWGLTSWGDVVPIAANGSPQYTGYSCPWTTCTGYSRFKSISVGLAGLYLLDHSGQLFSASDLNTVIASAPEWIRASQVIYY